MCFMLVAQQNLGIKLERVIVKRQKGRKDREIKEDLQVNEIQFYCFLDHL